MMMTVKSVNSVNSLSCVFRVIMVITPSLVTAWLTFCRFIYTVPQRNPGLNNMAVPQGNPCYLVTMVTWVYSLH